MVYELYDLENEYVITMFQMGDLIGLTKDMML